MTTIELGNRLSTVVASALQTKIIKILPDCKNNKSNCNKSSYTAKAMAAMTTTKTMTMYNNSDNEKRQYLY